MTINQNGNIMNITTNLVELLKGSDKMATPIKLKRIELGIKQKDLAKAVGITPQYMMNIESGKAKNPSIEIMRKIAYELKSSVQELFFEKKPENINSNIN